MKTNYPIKKISWNTYDKLVKKIFDQIHNNNFNYVVTILRGGSVLGMSIANNLDIPTCYISIKRSISNEPNSDFSNPKYLGEIGINRIKGKTILVCEDTIDTEITIKEVIKQLKKFNPHKIVISTLYNFSGNNTYISGCKANSHYWVIFPWEKKIYE